MFVQVAINWTICKGALPIPGAKNARQAREAAGATLPRNTPDFSTICVDTLVLCYVLVSTKSGRVSISYTTVLHDLGFVPLLFF